MKYALLSDLHSSIEDTKAVLNQINEIANDASIIGLGDLYECTIGKKKAKNLTNVPLDKAAILNEEFELLLTFPSIRGNQEERITLVTGESRFLQLPETIKIGDATLIHGHQLKWSRKWKPSFPELDTSLLFFGHSHESSIYRKKKKIPIEFGKTIPLVKKKYYINVGSVIDLREWCLYDSAERTITFMKAM